MLPAVSDARELARIRASVAPFRPALAEIARRHRLRGEAVPFASGSAPVFAVGHAAVVKLYAPLWPLDFAVEDAVLRRLERALPVATPERIGAGAIGAWRYLVLRRLRGLPLEVLLPSLDWREQVRALYRLGEAVHALHSAATAGLPSAGPSFEAMIARRLRERRAIMARVREPWASRLALFARETPARASRPVLLHTELGPGHVLAQRGGPRAHLTGLIDFVDAMAGDPEYDLAALAFFVTRGDARLLGAFLEGYGWPREARGIELSRRLLRYLVLHRYANLAWMTRLRPIPAAARTADDLARAWVGVP